MLGSALIPVRGHKGFAIAVLLLALNPVAVAKGISCNNGAVQIQDTDTLWNVIIQEPFAVAEIGKSVPFCQFRPHDQFRIYSAGGPTADNAVPFLQTNNKTPLIGELDCGLPVQVDVSRFDQGLLVVFKKIIGYQQWCTGHVDSDGAPAWGSRQLPHRQHAMPVTMMIRRTTHSATPDCRPVALHFFNGRVAQC